MATPAPTTQNNVPTNWDQWKKDLLKRLDAPDTPSNEAFLNAWARKEGGGGQNNPFNTTLPVAGATNFNSIGVKNYPTPDAGLEATYVTLTSPIFADVLGDLRAGRASTTKSYQGLHSWSAGPNAAAGKGYWSLQGVSTTDIKGASGTGEVGDVSADQGYGPGVGQCLHQTQIKLPLGVTSYTQTICWDKTIGALAMTGGGILIFGGIAVLLVGLARETQAGRQASAGLARAGAVGAVAGRAARSTTPRARQERRQTRDAAAARRTAPIRAAERQQAAEVRAEQQMAMRRTAARRQARLANATEKRRQETHVVRQATRMRSAANRPGRSRSAEDAPRSHPDVVALRRKAKAKAARESEMTEAPF